MQNIFLKIQKNIESYVLIWFFVALLFHFSAFIFDLLMGKVHVFTYNYFLPFGYNEYKLDYVIAIFKNILIANFRILLVILGLKLYRLNNTNIGWFKPSSVIKISFAFILAFFYEFVSVNIGKIFSTSFSKLFSSIHVGISTHWLYLDNSLTYIHLILISLVLPFFEEFFYRGFLYKVFEKKTGWIASVFITAFLFTLAHARTFDLHFNFSTFTIGIILGLLRKWDGSIWSSVAFHCGCNMYFAWFSIGI